MAVVLADLTQVVPVMGVAGVVAGWAAAQVWLYLGDEIRAQLRRVWSKLIARTTAPARRDLGQRRHDERV
ncbi:MAG: hypothetical protein AB1430_17325 [Pseudomonadota bacterium]